MSIIPFRHDLAPAFSELNREWIARLFRIEPADLKVLDHPYEAIIQTGGQIFFAMDGETAIGTVAMVQDPAGVYELAKMVVVAGHQGRGLGEALGQAAIRWALSQGARQIFLVTNSSLAGAIRLYERLGFEHRPMPPSDYARADIYMEYPVARERAS
jgi:GNAT superfamily N-acetyltransferase